jgi:hypothetical protein
LHGSPDRPTLVPGYRIVTLADPFDPRVSRKLGCGVLSVAIHVGLLLLVLSGGRHDGMPAGDEPSPILMWLEAPVADRSDSAEPRPLEPAVAPPASDAIAPQLLDSTQSDELSIEATVPVPIGGIELPATLAMSDVEMAELSRRLERLAGDSDEASRTEVRWEQHGTQYSAVLIRKPAHDEAALEHVVAQVSASDRGKHLTTVVSLRRLAFSQFTQIVDRWDPMVQVHDDEIVGRFHSNSRLNLLYDSSAEPRFLGKVTTAARSFNTEAKVRKRDADVFRGGKATRTARIELPESPQPFRWAPVDGNARIHEFTSDTSIRFHADGSYSFRARGSSEPETHFAFSEDPVFFVAAENVELFVQGVVAGRALVYSPLRIVIEGSLTYASDPRSVPDSGDYLGLVSNRYVEVAPPRVTGPGDLEIDAAIFAGRRFVVTNYNHPRKAMLRIYGSLTAGALTATEPRYGTRIEYDRRFEHRRPPGFPSTDRYEVIDWDGQWTEVPGRIADDSPL